MNKLPPSFLINLVMGLWNGLHGLANKFLPPEVRVLFMTSGIQKSMMIHTAARLQIADHLASGIKSLEDLALATSTHTDSLYRLMRALAGEGIFYELPGKRFETSPMGRALEKNATKSVWPLAMLVGHETWSNSWLALPKSIKTGEAAFEIVFGKKYFDYLATHVEAGDLFDLWMKRVAEINQDIIRAIFKSEKPGKVIDIGGGLGSLISTALESNPKLNGVLFDLPEVVEKVKLNDQVASRCEVVGGSFFESVPESGDIYILQQIIHDWDDEACIKILSNCADAMKEDGRIFIIDALLKERNKPDFGKYSDLQMLVISHGGRERTESEFKSLLSRAGLKLNRAIPTPSPLHLIIANK
jgi:hypothetical protein